MFVIFSDLEDLVQCQNDSDCPEDSTCPTQGDIKMKNICMCVRELRPLKKDGSCNSGKQCFSFLSAPPPISHPNSFFHTTFRIVNINSSQLLFFYFKLTREHLLTRVPHILTSGGNLGLAIN